MQDFKELKVWQKSHRLTLYVYRATAAVPKEEIYSLTSQMRRASSSIGANIAEGCCRDGDTEFGRFLYIAMGSASELENHASLARDLGFLGPEIADRLSAEIAEVKRMLSSLIGKLKADR
ncbi:MAG TPA: four helix bundle protein [Verrucomicrobiae bacterium]|nr:four helix bundle protein [Verrucomicrobiae bacterium]